MRERFARFAELVSEWAGSPYAFAGALFVIAAWAMTGPLFGYSDTWQLLVNTGTTILTFLMVFLIQSSQNRSDKAIQLKLDELIRASSARNRLIDLERASEKEIKAIEREMRQER